MSKQVYISADYDYYNGDQDVVEELVKWGKDDKQQVDFVICQIHLVVVFL